MKVLIFSEDFPPTAGGIAQWALGIANGMIQNNHEVHVFCREPKSHINQNLIFNDKLIITKIKSKHWKRFRTWIWQKALKNYLKSNSKPDLIIATTWNCARGLTRLANKNKIPVFCIFHGLEITRKLNVIKKMWLKNTMNNCNGLLAVSNFTLNKLLQISPKSKYKAFFQPNGVDPSKFKKQKVSNQEITTSFSPIILTLARVIERKGHSLVIEAVQKLVKQYPNILYLIAGPEDRNYKKKLVNKINSLNVSKNIKFLGMLPDSELVNIYNCADIYVMPSKSADFNEGDSEGFGITFLEANACNLPAIGSHSGGIPDAIIDGYNGFLVSPNNSKELIDKIKILLSNEALRKQMGKNGRTRILQELNWNDISKNIITKHKSLAQSH